MCRATCISLMICMNRPHGRLQTHRWSPRARRSRASSQRATPASRGGGCRGADLAALLARLASGDSCHLRGTVHCFICMCDKRQRGLLFLWPVKCPSGSCMQWQPMSATCQKAGVLVSFVRGETPQKVVSRRCCNKHHRFLCNHRFFCGTEGARFCNC